MNRTTAQQSTYIDRVKDFATRLSDLIDKDGNVLLIEWNAGMSALLTDAKAFSGTEDSKESVTAVMVTLIALFDLMGKGHRDNLYNVRK